MLIKQALTSERHVVFVSISVTAACASEIGPECPIEAQRFEKANAAAHEALFSLRTSCRR